MIGKNINLTVSLFWKHGNLLKGLNKTYLTLIQKTNNPKKMSCYKPIACATYPINYIKAS